MGIINKHSISNPIIRLFINKLFLIKNDIMKYIIVTEIDSVLKINLFLFFISGLFTVSAGA